MTHIVEVDEHLDYQKFYANHQDVQSAGRITWPLLQGLADNYPCPTCQRFFRALAYGGEDVVRLSTGRPVRNDPHYVVDLVNAIEQVKPKVRTLNSVHCAGGKCHVR